MDIIKKDLYENEPLEISTPGRPYHMTSSTIEKIRIIKEKIIRAKRLKKRIDTLIIYFYLGQFLEDVDLTKAKRMEVKQQFIIYQYIVAIRIYRIFEFQIEQLKRTKKCTVKDFHKLTSQQVIELCDIKTPEINNAFLPGIEDLNFDEVNFDNVIFIGAENLGGENC